MRRVALGAFFAVGILVACGSNTGGGPECFAATTCVDACGGKVIKSGCNVTCDAPLIDKTRCQCDRATASTGDACALEGMTCSAATPACGTPTKMPTCTCKSGKYQCEAVMGCNPFDGSMPMDSGSDAPSDAPNEGG